VVEGT
jgi:hypothetical protein